MHAKTRELRFLIFSLLAFSLISISCGKGTDTGSQAKVDATTNNDIVLKDKIDDDSSDAKLSQFAKVFNLDEKNTVTAARDFHFDPNNFSGGNLVGMTVLFNFFANSDLTFAKFAEFLFSRADVTFGNQNTAAVTATAAGRVDSTSGQLITNRESFPVFRSTFMFGFAITNAPKTIDGLKVLRETTKVLAFNAEAFRRYVFTATKLMGTDHIDYNPDGKAFTDQQVNNYMVAYDNSFRELKDKDAEGKAAVERERVEIDKYFREFTTNIIWIVEGKAYFPTVERDSNNKFTFTFVPVTVTADVEGNRQQAQ